MSLTSSPLATERVYDDFTGGSLDPERWAPLRMPLPDGTVHVGAQPSAQTVVEDGTLSVTVERLENSHDVIQPADNVKHLLFSTEQFAVPEQGRITFSVDQAATRTGPEPTDYKLGMVCFNVVEQSSGLVFDIASDGRVVFAVHEQLPVPGAKQTPFTRLVEAPFLPVDVSPGSTHRLSVTLDTRERTAQWTLDGHEIFSVSGPLLPEAVQIGLGMLTCVRLGGPGGGSIKGQGIAARWSRPSVTVHA